MIKRSLRTAVIQRFLSDREFEQFLKEYEKHRSVGRGYRVVTEEDKKILDEYLGGLSSGKLSKKYGYSTSKILNSVRLAALSRLKD